MHNKRWVIQPPITPQADEALVKFPYVLKQILFNRGYGTDAEARVFLKAEPNSNTDPFQLIGMGCRRGPHPIRHRTQRTHRHLRRL
ncbi:MAG: hypothetical protein MZU97_07400 [Bacillus subtilis]|nr:hypothetical protein [Bacillus subtilis]